MYEELMNHEETERAYELSKYFVILPAFRDIYRNINYTYPDIISKTVTKLYNSGSEPIMPKAELKKLLKESNLLHEDEVI